MLEEKRIAALDVARDKVLSGLIFEVKNSKDLNLAKQCLKKTGALKKVFTNLFDEPVKKAYEAYKSIRDRRNLITISIEEKESVLKQNIIQYLDDNDMQDGEFIRTEGVDFEINMPDFIEGIKNGNIPESLIAVNESELKKQIKTMGDLLDIPGITVNKKKFIRLKSENYRALA
ncbi:MAG: hypothetical protein ACYCSQ_00390 [bacterium]